MKDPKTGKETSGLTTLGITEAKPGQCDAKSWKQEMRDMATTIKEKMGMDKDGKMWIMDSSSRLATSALAAASISMTLY